MRDRPFNYLFHNDCLSLASLLQEKKPIRWEREIWKKILPRRHLPARRRRRRRGGRLGTQVVQRVGGAAGAVREAAHEGAQDQLAGEEGEGPGEDCQAEDGEERAIPGMQSTAILKDQTETQCKLMQDIPSNISTCKKCKNVH